LNLREVGEPQSGFYHHDVFEASAPAEVGGEYPLGHPNNLEENQEYFALTA
jgi:hypothetical protein